MTDRYSNGAWPRLRARGKALGALLVCACAAATAFVLSTQAASSRAAGRTVYVFPIPGGKVASPDTQLTFRGLPIGAVGSITVTGSVSGVHQGSFAGDTDGRGGSFLPAVPFTSGETVTVNTSLNVAGARNGTYHFAVAVPAGPKTGSPWKPVRRNANDVQIFQSRPDLTPVRDVINQHDKSANGDIFLAPQYGPLQDGPMVLDPNGKLLWFKPLPSGESADDVRVQIYHHQKVLTWWQGEEWAGVGLGEDVINNTAYQQIGTVQAGNGMSADLHEFLITKQNTALIISEYPVIFDTSSLGGAKQQLVFDSVVQEIDIPTGLVLFQWDSLDHIPLKWSYQGVPFHTFVPYDPYHINSVAVDFDGNLIISARNTNGIYKVDRHSGKLIWVLGGKHSSFRLAPGTCWAQQHDATIQSYGDNWLTMFDDDYGPPATGCHRWSKGLKLYMNLHTMTAQPALGLTHSPPIHANFEGNYEQLPNHDVFLGWGQVPDFSEYNSQGGLVFDGHLVDFTASYRVYRFRWSGNPQTRPAVAAVNKGSSTIVYASWNGATNVAFWRVLGGSDPNHLSTLSESKKNGFETAIPVSAQANVAVQALNSSGAVLQTSATVAP